MLTLPRTTDPPRHPEGLGQKISHAGETDHFFLDKYLCPESSHPDDE